MRHHHFALALAAALLLAQACADTPVTPASPAVEPATTAAHEHGTPTRDLSLDVEVQRKLAELRRWSAPFHSLEKAAEAGYDLNIGCIDETINGVDPSVARGMGYHVTRSDVDLIGDGVIDIDAPELLVYAPHPQDAALPKAERLQRARLVAFDYYVPGALWTAPEPPEFFGEPFHWSVPFQGWIKHIYLWGHNPDGIFENFSPAVTLCTELLNP